MHIKYWAENKNTEDERHYMNIDGTGITVMGVTKSDCFNLLQNKLIDFITEFQMLRNIEIGNIQENNFNSIEFDGFKIDSNKQFEILGRMMIEEMKKHEGRF